MVCPTSLSTLVRPRSSGSVRVTGGFAAVLELVQGQEAVASVLLPGDHDGDGRPDLLTVSITPNGERLPGLLQYLGGQGFAMGPADGIDLSSLTTPGVGAKGLLP